eukprot:TRINITY_DN13622_c0_g1_i1.p1 TRINITY_DN13622_c0_g1~~TRINITY_DN13622_c0_g1_i1.p1  ORF type:complete len:353 (+),score=48.21 TRINITY_DN13622_c0_g1_i1:39-1097(+)
MPRILVTGGAGYIGSHTCVVLIQQGYDVVVVDSLVNSSEESLRRVQKITGKAVTFMKCDLVDKERLQNVFQKCGPFDTCIHFAALKAVGESVELPMVYYKNNIVGTLTLLEVMAANGCKNIVFSSSATVYGSSPTPYTETTTTGVGVTAPYGQTKVMIETILKDLANPNAKTPYGNDWNVVLLRYFNPVGNHPSGLIGDDPTGIPNNLMPFISQVCVGRRSHLTIFGNDYETVDGTCERDYIHVVDLAEGHVAALKYIASRPSKSSGMCEAFNLGSGKPTSVLALLRAMERAVGKPIPFKYGDRRVGDLPISYADPKKAQQHLKWSTSKTIDDICKDTWKWQSENPKGLSKL